MKELNNFPNTCNMYLPNSCPNLVIATNKKPITSCQSTSSAKSLFQKVFVSMFIHPHNLKFFSVLKVLAEHREAMVSVFKGFLSQVYHLWQPVRGQYYSHLTTDNQSDNASTPSINRSVTMLTTQLCHLASFYPFLNHTFQERDMTMLTKRELQQEVESVTQRLNASTDALEAVR